MDRPLSSGPPERASKAIAERHLRKSAPEMPTSTSQSWTAGFVAAIIWTVLVMSFGCSQEKRTVERVREITRLLQEHRLAEAEVELKRLLEIHSGLEWAREELQWLYFNQFRTRELEQLLESHLAREPANFSLLNHLMMSSCRPPVPREGVNYLEQVEARQPGQPGVVRGLGYCYWQFGELAKAREFLDRAWQSDSADVETRWVVAAFLLEQGEVAAAERILRPSESIPAEWAGDDRWWWLSSQAAESEGRNAEALDLLERALERRPAEIKYVHRRGMLLQKLGRRVAADEAFRTANRLEGCQMELTEIALSGALADPTPELCRQLAKLCDCLGRTRQAAGWRALANAVGESQ